MSDIRIQRSETTGRITLTRPGALNALTLDMVRAIRAALADWAADPGMRMAVIDAEGSRAFCAGGDLSALSGALAGEDPGAAGTFWAEEYRMNLELSEFPKPVAVFLQGHCLGGGVGLGCHNSHRIVCESSQLGLPEVRIGLVPDAGGSLLLGRAPGRLGEFLGLTGVSLGAADAIHAGFADYFVPEADWPALIGRLMDSGDWEDVDRATRGPGPGRLAMCHDMIDEVFAADTVPDIAEALAAWTGETAESARAAMDRNAPLAMCAALRLIRQARAEDDMAGTLAREYRYGVHATTQGDVAEGIRVTLRERGAAPRWAHPAAGSVLPEEVDAMLAPLGEADWRPR